MTLFFYFHEYCFLICLRDIETEKVIGPYLSSYITGPGTFLAANINFYWLLFYG